MKIELSDQRIQIFQELEGGCSGEEIAEKFGISRVAVWKFVKRLEEMGYRVKTDRREGYRIIGSPDPSPFHMALAAKQIPGIERFIYLKETDSTNRMAKEISNAVIFAETQTSGRGRLGRAWSSEKGGIYTSISLNIRLPVNEIPKITLLFGLAVCRALEDYGAKIKWPNDVLIKGKKVSGILSEFVGEELSSMVVVGIGINVKNRIPEELRGKAISISEVDERVSITRTFEGVCREISYLLRIFPEKWRDILEEWRLRSDTLGKKVKINMHGEIVEGIAKDVDGDGGLIVDTGKELRKIISGECFYTNY